MCAHLCQLIYQVVTRSDAIGEQADRKGSNPRQCGLFSLFDIHVCLVSLNGEKNTSPDSYCLKSMLHSMHFTGCNIGRISMLTATHIYVFICPTVFYLCCAQSHTNSREWILLHWLQNNVNWNLVNVLLLWSYSYWLLHTIHTYGCSSTNCLLSCSNQE